MAGMLYLCATPIGNLEDMTLRALRTLKEVDIIAAEDTRNSRKLLHHFGIQTPMTSYHEHNKIEKGKELVRQIQEGKTVALITDAGMPGISDPGEELVRMCQEQGITVTALPGACACVTALTLSGLSTRRFCFEGFLPMQKKERAEILRALETETRTILLYEAPHRLRRTLGELEALFANRKISICRELTKKYETIFQATVSEAAAYYATQEPRGEYVLVLEGKSKEEQKIEARSRWASLSVQDHMRQYLEKGMEKKEAMRQVAKERGVPKREIYQILEKE